jgi:hypothetical protein
MSITIQGSFGKALWPGLQSYYTGVYNGTIKPHNVVDDDYDWGAAIYKPLRKPLRCSYCGSKTLFSTVNCNNCGGPI